MPTDELKLQCELQRQHAREHPIGASMIRAAKLNPTILAQYSKKYGKYRIEISYETYCKPFRWHAMVTILEEIGEGEWGVPMEAMLALESWTETDYREARDILGECLAPEILRHMQPVTEHSGLWSLHFLAPVDAPPMEIEHERTESRIILAN